jgi:hypothetical protein
MQPISDNANFSNLLMCHINVIKQQYGEIKHLAGLVNAALNNRMEYKTHANSTSSVNN